MKIVKAGLLLCLLCIIIAGCKPAFTDAPSETIHPSDEVMELLEEKPASVPSESEQQTDDLRRRVDIADGDIYTTSFKPNEDMPEITLSFTLVGESFRGPDLPVHYHYTCAVSQENNAIQSFEIQSHEILQPSHVNFIDIDFDGFWDMEILWVSGSTNWPHDYFRFNAETGDFEETVFFSASGRGVEFFSDTKQAIVTINDGYVPCRREMFQYADGNYSHMRTEYSNRDFETGAYSLSIREYAEDGEWKEIYSATLTENEYYGDLTVRDNYLRFGTESTP